MVIKKSSLPAAQSALRELAPKVPDAVSELAAIKNLRRQIERALRIGYSYEEIAQTLAKYDIDLSSSELESGLAQLKKADKKRLALKRLKVPELSSANAVTSSSSSSFAFAPGQDLEPVEVKDSKPQKSTARATKRAY
jgi:hypothetical protein